MLGQKSDLSQWFDSSQFCKTGKTSAVESFIEKVIFQGRFTGGICNAGGVTASHFKKEKRIKGKFIKTRIIIFFEESHLIGKKEPVFGRNEKEV